jgi:hypothetical protein
MSPIVIAIAGLVILVVAFKVIRAVTSGCFKFAAMIFLLAALGAAYYILKDRIVVP